MISDEAFLRTIRALPDDDTPRLVYADWLEETGETDRAEFIRLQCSGQESERERELLQVSGPTWAGPLARQVYGYTFRRGFIEEVTIGAASFLKIGEGLLAANPVRSVRFIGARAVMERLFASPLLRCLRALHLTDCRIGDDGAGLLAACPHLQSLQSLRLGNNALTDTAIQFLTDFRNLTGLQSLVLSGNQIEDLGSRLLAASECFPNLRALDLSDNKIGDLGAEALAGTQSMPLLKHLDLSNQYKGLSMESAPRRRRYPIQSKHQSALIERYGAQACVF